MPSHPDPFGPPPTRPPTLPPTLHVSTRPAVPEPLPPTGPGRISWLVAQHRLVVIWLGAAATVFFSGITGLALTSRWSYASLGLTFAALLLVVLAVSTPAAAAD